MGLKKGAKLAITALAAGLTGVVVSDKLETIVLGEDIISTTVYADTVDTGTFIEQISTGAVEIANSHDLYPSVMIAQAILESQSGNSDLGAAPHYNLFGIKGSYNGQSVILSTQEDDGTGQMIAVETYFCSYNSWDESFEDYANILSWDYYTGVHRSRTSTYQDATAALTGTYATDINYDNKLNHIIEIYGLTKYDVISDTSTSTPDGKVWNDYRGQYTTPEVLAEDEAWVSYTNNR